MVDDDRAEQFIQLLAQHERRLAAYVLTFVPRSADADDILQETKLALWRSFDQFEIGTNFGAWARQAALNRIFDFRKRKGRESQHLVFSDDCLQQLADAFEQDAPRRETQLERLSDCVAKLSPNHRRILSLRYGEGLQMQAVADRIDRTVPATYRVLSRIRLVLRDCVRGISDGVLPASESAR
ncbi:sigma-70 family RNA polymerase sigma factor [Stieleria maiorica]|nr:sigma-70 family RNA polymerase sigma factor [Stieleria maiorica]